MQNEMRIHTSNNENNFTKSLSILSPTNEYLANAGINVHVSFNLSDEFKSELNIRLTTLIAELAAQFTVETQ